MNVFEYISTLNVEIQSGLILWREKINEYVNNYYQSDIYNARETDFFRCISKVNILERELNDPDNYEKFRAVKDSQGLIQAMCLCEIAQVEIDNETYRCLALDNLTNAPWNTIIYPHPERKKGAATALVEQLARESQRLQLGGILKALVIREARDFYERVGFIDTDGLSEMILTRNAASMLILDQEQRLRTQPFD